MNADRLTLSVEEAGLNAWPAFKEIFYDGWLIRLGGGVNVIAHGVYPLKDKIRHCETVYHAHGLPPYFRIRSDCDPELDKLLAEKGFRAEDTTLTLFMDFERTPPPEPAAGVRVELFRGHPPRAWLEAHARFTSRPAAAGIDRSRVLQLVALPIAFAAACDAEGYIVSVAYGAVHDRIVSLQWVATDPDRRRNGLSRATLAVLLDWASREVGAKSACLQVVADNAPAVNLYEKIGFDRELYRYHYRVR